MYKADTCPHCKETVSLIQKLAKAKDIPVNVVDVYECGKKCARIQYVPYIELDGKHIELEQLAKVLE